MSSTSTSTSLLSSPPLPECEGQDAPSWVLLDIWGYIAQSPPRGTFATSTTSTGKTIRVAFSVARPPNVSHFCVHCPDLAAADFNWAPKVISAEADLILFRLSVSRYARLSRRHYDYFLYRAHPQCPSLNLLPNPDRNIFLDNEVALVRCSDDEYVIAALSNTYYKMPLKENGTLKEPLMFNFCLYRSSKATEGWNSKLLSVAEPLRDRVCPVEETARYHRTTKVITLGGRHGTVGWVDLWRGILVCDVLEENPVLHDLPLPLPGRGNWAFYHKRCSYIFRDITVSLSKDCIKYIELEDDLPRKEAVTAPPDSYLDWFHQNQCHEVHSQRDGWKATTWSMPIPIGSWKDWSPGCTVNVDEIVVEPMYSKLLPRPPGSISEPSGATLLPLLTTAFPTMSMDDDVVYLLSTAGPTGDMDVVISVDLRKKTLRGVGKLAAGKDFTSMRNCTTEISKYLNLNTAAGKREEEKQADQLNEARKEEA